jgi:zinc transporter ZupT
MDRRIELPAVAVFRFPIVPAPLILVVLISAVALAGVALGVWLAVVPRLSHSLVPLSGAMIVAVCLFWVLPELAAQTGWLASTAGLAAGCGVLWLVNRYVYPVCPSCAHTHDHGHCARELHGFAMPLVLATAVHSFLDGWGVILSQQDVHGSMSAALLAGIAVHKLPEGIALGVMLRAALGSRWSASGWAAGAELATVVGGAVGYAVARELSPQLLTLLVSLAGGCFLFLGFHAIHMAPMFRNAMAPVSRLFSRS